jgi:hypothetical protein
MGDRLLLGSWIKITEVAQNFYELILTKICWATLWAITFIQVNGVVDKKRILGKNGGPRRRGIRGR